jgi:hypothetical protein
MSFDNGLKASFSLPAGADLTGKQFHAVVVNSSGNAASAGANALAAGILQNKPNTGQPATVCYDGVSKAAIGATVAAGAKLTTDAAGKLVTATTGQAVVGIALAGGAVNEIIPVLMTRVALG